MPASLVDGTKYPGAPMPLSLTDRLTLTLAALNLAVLFFQLLLLKRQADISLRQAEISSGQLVATADSAAAAKKQAEVAEKTLVNLERSHLFVDEVKPVFTTSPRQFGRHAGQIIYMVELQIGLVIRNFGKYAATLERYTVKVEIPSKHGEIPQMDETSACGSPSSGLVTVERWKPERQCYSRPVTRKGSRRSRSMWSLDFGIRT